MRECREVHSVSWARLHVWRRCRTRVGWSLRESPGQVNLMLARLMKSSDSVLAGTSVSGDLSRPLPPPAFALQIVNALALFELLPLRWNPGCVWAL